MPLDQPAVRLWWEPELTCAARHLAVHGKRPYLRRPRCAAGCGRWPCLAFRAALAQVVAHAWRWQAVGRARPTR